MHLGPSPSSVVTCCSHPGADSGPGNEQVLAGALFPLPQPFSVEHTGSSGMYVLYTWFYVGYVCSCGMKVYVSAVYMWHGCVSLHRLWQQISS